MLSVNTVVAACEYILFISVLSLGGCSIFRLQSAAICNKIPQNCEIYEQCKAYLDTLWLSLDLSHFLPDQTCKDGNVLIERLRNMEHNIYTLEIFSIAMIIISIVLLIIHRYSSRVQSKRLAFGGRINDQPPGNPPEDPDNNIGASNKLQESLKNTSGSQNPTYQVRRLFITTQDETIETEVNLEDLRNASLTRGTSHIHASFINRYRPSARNVRNSRFQAPAPVAALPQENVIKKGKKAKVN